MLSETSRIRAKTVSLVGTYRKQAKERESL
jgi:hypothetical protein